MLSIGTLSAGQAASGYYKSEGYYIEGTPEAEHSAIYHGKGADGADLVGASKEKPRMGVFSAATATASANTGLGLILPSRLPKASRSQPSWAATHGSSKPILQQLKKP